MDRHDGEGSAGGSLRTPGRTPLFTLGHGTASASELAALLHAAGIGRLVDVRTAPGSRRNPDVARAALQRWLPEQGLEYRWERRLGGWRKARPDAPDTALRNRSFAGYAAHMRSPEFREAVDQLLDEARSTPTAVMCAESLWWRCHRRMISDFVTLARQVPVRHLMHDGRQEPHRPSDIARLSPNALLVYDGGADSTAQQPPLPFAEERPWN